MDYNLAKTVTDKTTTNTTTLKEKQFSSVLASLGIYLFITTINTNSACLMTRLRVQIILKRKELENVVSDRQQKKFFLVLLPFTAFQTNQKTSQLERLHYILSSGKWLHKQETA